MPEPPMMPSTDLVIRHQPFRRHCERSEAISATETEQAGEIASARCARLAMTHDYKRRAPFRGPCQHLACRTSLVLARVLVGEPATTSPGHALVHARPHLLLGEVEQDGEHQQQYHHLHAEALPRLEV